MAVSNAQVGFMVKPEARSHLRTMTAQLKQVVGARIRAARLRAGMSQEAVAARINRTPESISNIERAQQLPALDTLLELAAVLEMPLLDIIDAAKEDRKLTAQRALGEAKLGEIVRSLSDTALAIAVEQLKALMAVKLLCNEAQLARSSAI